MMKKTFRAAIAALLILSLSFGLISCRNGSGTNDDPPDPLPSGTAEYTVTLTSEYGMPLAGVFVLVHDEASPYPNSTVKQAETDRSGRVSFVLDSAPTYSFRLLELPAGYTPEAKYYFTDRTADVRVASAPIDGNHREVDEYSVGDIVHDLSLTTVDGVEHRISELLAENELLILNFWFTTCGPCRSEFPALIDAYSRYAGKGVELVAITDNGDPAGNVRDYRVSVNGVSTALPFPVVKADDAANGYGRCELIMKFGGMAYPTTVFIDRAGMIAYVHEGVISAVQLNALIEHFTAEDYRQGSLGG